MAFRARRQGGDAERRWEVKTQDGDFVLMLRRPTTKDATQIMLASSIDPDQPSLGIINANSISVAVRALIVGWDGVVEPNDENDQEEKPIPYSAPALEQLMADFPASVTTSVCLALSWAIRGFPDDTPKSGGARAPHEESDAAEVAEKN